MKKTVILLTALLLAQSCTKEKNGDLDQSLARKYARFSAPVYKEKEMKNWLTTLAKAEYVDLLEVTEIQVKKHKKTVARVRLSDDSEGYMNPDHLADRPVVFLSDTKAYDRNNQGSPVYMTVPRGTIAFIIAEKGDWSQVYAGRILDKNLTRQWVKGGFSADENLILEARAYEEAVAGLESDESTAETRDQAVKKLNELAASSRAFGDLARKKLEEQANQTGERTVPEEGNMDNLPNKTVEEH